MSDEKETTELEVTEDLDFNEISDLEEQKAYCGKMILLLGYEEKRLKKEFLGIQTLNDVVDSDDKIRADLSEYVGYHYGSIAECMTIVGTALANLERFREGKFDEINSGARGMFLSLWYNLALVKVGVIKQSLSSLELLETEVIDQLVADNQGLISIDRGYIH